MSESNGRILVVKQWHVLLTFVGWLVLAVLAYASVKSQGEENARQIQEMKQQNVQKEQYQEFQQDIQGGCSASRTKSTAITTGGRRTEKGERLPASSARACRATKKPVETVLTSEREGV